MKTIGGSIFVHNAIEFDYCIIEAIRSLSAFCDEVIVGDAQSTDNTLDILKEIEKDLLNIRVIENLPWEIQEDKSRLPALANIVKNMLNTDWHFMLQADEIIHENSIPYIYGIVNDSNGFDSAFVRRFNIWGSFDKHIKFDSSYRPCSDIIVRFGEKKLNAYGDAESFEGGNKCCNAIDYIFIFHYGFMRDNMISKVCSMQSWFWGKEAQPDSRYIKMRGEGGIFKPYEIIPESELTDIPMQHPIYAREWIEKRKNRIIRR